MLYIEFIPSQNLSHCLSSPSLCVYGSISLTFMDVKFWVRCSLSIFFVECKVVGIFLSVSWMCWKIHEWMHLIEVILPHVQPFDHSGWFVLTERTKSRLETWALVFQYSEIGTTILFCCEKQPSVFSLNKLTIFLQLLGTDRLDENILVYCSNNVLNTNFRCFYCITYTVNHRGRAPCKTPPEWACCIFCNMGSFHII